MSRLGVDRKPRSSRYQVDPTDELTAFCDEELPRLDQRVGPKPEPPTPNSENFAHEKAPFRHFQTSALPVTPPARDGLSSLSYVSFLDREIYFSHLRQGLINEPQTLAILPKMPPRPWHRPTAQRRAPTANRAQSERRLSRSRARARLCHSSHHSADRRRETLAMLCSLLC